MTILVEPLKGNIDGKDYFLELGIIEDAFLGREDHGIFTYTLMFNFAGSHQGAGNFVLADPTNFGKHVQAILDFFGSNWCDLQGQDAYVMRESVYGPIVGILSKNRSKFMIFSEVLNG